VPRHLIYREEIGRADDRATVIAAWKEFIKPAICSSAGQLLQRSARS